MANGAGAVGAGAYRRGVASGGSGGQHLPVEIQEFGLTGPASHTPFLPPSHAPILHESGDAKRS